jgi:hypothetical protein
LDQVGTYPNLSHIGSRGWRLVEMRVLRCQACGAIWLDEYATTPVTARFVEDVVRLNAYFQRSVDETPPQARNGTAKGVRR